MKVIMISTDRNIFTQGSAVQARMIEYGKLFGELHIIVFSTLAHKVPSYVALSSEVHVYSTQSKRKWHYMFDAAHIGKQILKQPTKERKVVVTTQDPFETAIAGWLIVRGTSTAFNIQVHTDFLSPYFAALSRLNKLRVTFAKFLLPKATSIRVVSERIKESLKELNLSIEPTVLPIYTDIDALENKSPFFYLKQKYSQFETIILTVARLEKEKNISLQLQALQEVIKQHPRTGLVIAGEGSERKKLEEEVRDRKLEGNVVFAGWQTDLTSFYRTADIYLCTSDYEGFGLSILEAAVLRCSIVATDVGLIGSVLHDEDSVLVAESTAHSVSTQIRRLIENAGLKDHIRDEAYKEAATLRRKKSAYLRDYKATLI